MALKQLISSLVILLLLFKTVDAQQTFKINPNDTITYNDSNSEKVVALGSAIETAVHNNQVDDFISKWYKNVFIKRIIDLNPNSGSMTADYAKTFVSGIKKGLDKFPNEIVTEVQNGSYYDFVNYRYDQYLQTYYLLFRLYSTEGGMNYHDFRVHKKNGEMLFSDAYIYYSGENLSQTMSRLMSYVTPKDKILGLVDSPKNKDIDNLFVALKFKNSGHYELAYKLINTIKSEVSKDKFFLIFKTLIASNVDDNKYLAALEELINTYPNDPTIVLNKIDYHIYKNEYFEAIQVINQLQEETEDDFLNYLKANVAFEDKNYDFALNNYKYTIDNYPDFFEGQAGYLSTLVMMKNYDKATKYVASLIKDGYAKQDIINYIEENDAFGLNILQPLVESKSYKNWKLKSDN
ncbi:lipopolysaccharide assembly protein LapB [Olleya sp. ITB9]|uniref:tetratricopeptide repeat protein n=1 Tax=Olleya sp. ITB9 TaxID=1715648 RepID=UPI0006D01E69|nr:hypothetical protein [Olleya sp. ITB9]